MITPSLAQLLQDFPPQLDTTQRFFWWFLYGLNGNGQIGIGGWVIFLLLALAAVIWVSYDNGTRRLRALGWQMAVIFTAALILPVLLYRFTTIPDWFWGVLPDPSPLAPYREPIFYLGILGGIVPVVLAIGYYVTFRGLTGCPRGLHPPFEAVLVNCPGCARLDNPQVQVGAQTPVGGGGVRREPFVENVVPPPPPKRKVQAWLVSEGGKSYQLCEHETMIGRLSSNDIYLTGDATVSRQHAKIVEQNGRFRLIDLGSKGQTRVNGHVVREPVILDPDDEIKFGDSTVLRFVGTAR